LTNLAALSWPGGQLVYSALLSQVDAARQMLQSAGIRVLAPDIENGPGRIANLLDELSAQAEPDATRGQCSAG